MTYILSYFFLFHYAVMSLMYYVWRVNISFVLRNIFLLL